MSDKRSYAQVQSAGPDPLIWSGCEGIGACRPCGRIHYYVERGTYHCLQNREFGCPSPIPETGNHRWNRGRCEKCGLKGVWVADDGRQFVTVEHAKLNGVKRRQLTLAEPSQRRARRHRVG